MYKDLREFIPSKLASKLGSDSNVCVLSGADVFRWLRGDASIIMGCNPRIHHVIPGVMRAAEELDAVVAFQLTKTEGGIDGGYTGMTPGSFAAAVIRYAEENAFTRPFIIHADHVTVTGDTHADIAGARVLVGAQIDAGYTSFAVDASFNPLPRNIDIVAELARPVIAEGYSLEVELGELKPGETEKTLTTAEEAEEFLSELTARGIRPQLLAISNGSKKGNYLEGEVVAIDLERTGEIYGLALDHGVSGLVQHGITGTPLRIVGRLADYGIRKGNIGTLWQNVAHAGLPFDLMDDMVLWSRENRRDIKYATAVFRDRIDAIPQENIRQIHDMAYREAKEFITAFRGKGSAGRLRAFLKGM